MIPAGALLAKPAHAGFAHLVNRTAPLDGVFTVVGSLQRTNAAWVAGDITCIAKEIEAGIAAVCTGRRAGTQAESCVGRDCLACRFPFLYFAVRILFANPCLKLQYQAQNLICMQLFILKSPGAKAGGVEELGGTAGGCLDIAGGDWIGAWLGRGVLLLSEPRPAASTLFCSGCRTFLDIHSELPILTGRRCRLALTGWGSYHTC